jgi:DNA invertase Pin-like site-specific DNA recombinase
LQFLLKYNTGTGEQMRAIGYCRISTEEQSQQGVSLSNQAQKIQAYCTAKDWEITAVIRDEGYSGKDLNRPGIQEIIKGCRKRAFDVVVTLKLDRLTRSVKDLGYLVEDVFNKNAVAFSSLQDNFDTSTANGRMVMNILATLAQWEGDIISERTRDSMQFMKNSLKLVGAVPFGFRLAGKDLEPDPTEMRTVQNLLFMKAKGASYQRISNLKCKWNRIEERRQMVSEDSQRGGASYSVITRGPLGNKTVLFEEP